MMAERANYTKMGWLRRAAVGMSLVCALTAAATAMPILPTDAPLDRVLANLQAKLKDHPEDPDLLYKIGRAHSLAYVTKLDWIRCLGREEEGIPLPPDVSDYRPKGEQPKGQAITKEQAEVHLNEAVKYLGRAIRIRQEPRYYLALASVLETAGQERIGLDPAIVLPVSGSRRTGGDDDYVLDLPKPNAESVARARALGATLDPGATYTRVDQNTLATLWKLRADAKKERQKRVVAILSDFWLEQTLDAYFIAYAKAMATEAKFDSRPSGTLGLRISVEAGEGFLRVSKTKSDTKADAVRVAIVSKSVEELAKTQRNGGITPVVFSFSPSRSVDELVDAEARVNFKLDGTCLPQSWSWVKPDTAILVWDPAHTGKITSGRQLFGSATWWMMFGDGYQAMDALDDNRDGWLSGSELTGLAVWSDRNGNGVSDPGEVVPIERTEIEAIACAADGSAADGLANAAGLRLKSGRVLPTYDWIAMPASPSKERHE